MEQLTTLQLSGAIYFAGFMIVLIAILVFGNEEDRKDYPLVAFISLLSWVIIFFALVSAFLFYKWSKSEDDLRQRP